MLRIGEYNKMKVDREKDFGFYLRELDGRADLSWSTTSKIITRRK